jgi:hypothetical protein
MRDNSGHKKMNIRPIVNLYHTVFRNSLAWQTLWTFSFACLIFVVFCGSALAISLRLKLEMLGYNEDEISAIISGKERREDIDRKIKLNMLCLNVPPPLLPSDNADHGETKALKTNPDAPALEKRTPSWPIEGFATKRPDLQEKEKQYLPIIRSVAKKTRIDESLIMAVIKVESDFNPEALSPKGAMGLMQLVPSTASSLGVANPFNPKENIHGGAEYLSQCIDIFQDIELALAAYNAGPHLVCQLKKVPPYPETRNFIRDVFFYRKIYDRLL